jgi:hypothetical protein
MDKQQAKELIRNTFESPFDKEKFIVFIKNLLNKIEEKPFTYQGNYIPDAFKPYINKLERIGKYSDGENEIDLLIVRLKKESSLERARTMQRNFIAWYLKGSRGGKLKDAALVAFVSPDEDLPAKASAQAGKNFFNDILEPLFYEALARERDDNFYSRFNCKIPFLNGGLFEPIGGYDWVHTDILLPDDLFSNSRRTPEGDIGDGILDVFDRFNFTVKEDEPLEKEVAIDPELLGKLYEKFNAIRPDNFYEYKKALASGKKSLEKQFNKKFGVYYTPREIVHYMCQQSLIHYLESSTGIPACGKDTDKNVCATIKEYEHQIDQLVYKLYELTDEEIK